MVENEEPSEGGTTCTTNSDCAPGHICKNGRCVKETSTIPVDPPPVGLNSIDNEEA